MATEVKAHIKRQHYHVDIEAGKNTLVADEPIDHGGGEEGFNPYQLLLASLGACTSATLRMYADRKGMNLDEVKVNLTLECDDENNVTRIGRVIQLIGNLTDEEKARLHVIADKCPVHKVLSNPIAINTQIQ